MTQRFQTELTELREAVARRGASVLDVVTTAFDAFLEGDETKARSVLDAREAETRAHDDMADECQRLLALYQPVAGDLRLIVSILKVNDELERMHRLAEAVSRVTAGSDASKQLGDLREDFDSICRRTAAMVRDALHSFRGEDPQSAEEVLTEDDAVDRLKKCLNRALRDRITENPEEAERLLRLLDVPRRIERIADLATNISEEVIHISRGEIPRHGRLMEEEE